MTRREEELARVRETYARYVREGRNRLWDPANPGYARMTRDRDAALVDILRRVLPSDGSGTALDLGCGNGRLAQVAREAELPIRSWIGVDLDADSVAAAAEAHPWADFIEASADALPWPEGAFDVVVATTLFSSFPSADLEVAVAGEIGRVLRPGGALVWYDLRYDNPSNRDVHGITSRRLAELFPGWSMELRSITLVPPVARRLGRITAPLYSVLHAMPALRSHLVGVLRRGR